MKKHISIVLAAAILLTGCRNTAESDITSVAEVTANSESSGETADARTSEPDAPQTNISSSVSEADPVEEKDALPTMDGSTSAIPLETGMKATLLDLSWYEASELVSHTKTHIAFQNLLDGNVDLIFSVPISDEQQALADEQGVKLTFTPVAKEGFVFVVNAENPIDELTSEQIRAIYSGEITNWKELGGNDEPIVPFQRNKDSGSQNYMTEFMGETALPEPQTEFVPGAMGALLDAVSSYDNGTGAIGYSVYSYAAQMYADANKIKLIAVDGIKPTKATMADDSYPLSSCTYIITTDSADENTLRFVDWAVSDEGQRCVLDSGYLPVNGMEIPAEYLPYEAVGTGCTKPAGGAPDKISSYVAPGNDKPLDCLADKDFEAEINADISAAMDKLKHDNPNNEENSFRISYSCFNGYLEVLVYIWEDFDNVELSMSGFSVYKDCYSFVYDIIGKKRLTQLSDLFFEGEDFVPLLNRSIQENTDYINTIAPKLAKADFAGLTGDPDCFGLDWLCFERTNPYYNYNLEILFGPTSARNTTAAGELMDMMVISEYRDVSECFLPSENIYEYTWELCSKVQVEDNGDILSYIDGSRFFSEQEIEELNKKLEVIQHDFCEQCHINGYSDRELYPEWSIRGNFVFVSAERFYSSPADACYDIDTLKRLTPSDLFIDSRDIGDIPENAWIGYIYEGAVNISYIDENGKYDTKYLNNIDPDTINPRYRD